MQRDVVAGRVKVGQADQLGAEILRDFGGHVRVVRHDPHFESERALHHFAPDAAEPDHAERLAAQLIAEELLLLPLAGARRGIGLRNMARHREHQRERVFGDRNGIPAGRIHDEHAGLGGGVQIDIIHANAGAADDAQFRRLLQNRLGHLHGAAHQQRVGSREVLRVFLGIGDDDVPAVLRLEMLDARGGQGLSDQYIHKEVADDRCPRFRR